MTNVHNPHIRQAMREQLLQYASFAPPAADDNYFMVSTVPTIHATLSTTTLLAAGMTKSYVTAWPTVPVLVCTQDTDDDWTAVSAVIVGIDQFGNRIAETITGANGTGSQAGTWTATAVNAFCTLVSIVITITGDVSAADRYKLGYAKTYGLGAKIEASGDVVVHNFGGATDAGTISTVYSTYVVAGTPDASSLLQFYIRSNAY